MKASSQIGPASPADEQSDVQQHQTVEPPKDEHQHLIQQNEGSYE